MRSVEDMVARAKAMTAAEREAERLRQFGVLVGAIVEAINDTMAGFAVPIGNAVGPALVLAEAKWLASMEADDRRKTKREMEALRPRALAEAVRETRVACIRVSVREHDA